MAATATAIACSRPASSTSSSSLGLKPYDIVPLVPIIEGAGGVVTTWEGEPALDGGRIVAAGGRRVHEQALAILRGVD